jgi:hypothetical protein
VKVLLVGDLHSHRNLSSWPKELQLEQVRVADPITTLDFQAWALENNAPVARLSGIDGTDNFDQLIGKVREGGGVSFPSRWDPALCRLTLQV